MNAMIPTIVIVLILYFAAMVVIVIYACGGSWMVSDALIREGNFEEITKLTKEAVELAK